MTVRVCIAGATGWVGRSLIEAALAAEDLVLAGAVARRQAGEDVGTALGGAPVGVPLSASVADALAAPAAEGTPGGTPGGTDVLIDYTHPTAVKAHVLAAVERGVAAVVGTSGLTAADYDEIDRAARDRGVGVVAAGNFSLTATLLQHFALIAAAHVPEWEILDYGKSTKPDVPSGTARELAERLGQVGRPPLGVPLDKLVGPKEARGADVGGSRVHSIRLPSYVLSCEVVFGMAGERLSLRHDAGSSAEPYVAGTLLAARRVREITGLVRGLDRLLFG